MIGGVACSVHCGCGLSRSHLEVVLYSSCSLGASLLVAGRNSEAVASLLEMHAKVNRGQLTWPLLGGWSLLGEPAIGGFTVYPEFKSQ